MGDQNFVEGEIDVGKAKYKRRTGKESRSDQRRTAGETGTDNGTGEAGTDNRTRETDPLSLQHSISQKMQGEMYKSKQLTSQTNEKG